MVSGGDTASPPNLRMQKGGRLQPPLEKTRGGFRSLNSQAGAGGGEEDPGTPPALCVFWATAEVSQMNRLKARLGGVPVAGGARGHPEGRFSITPLHLV